MDEKHGELSALQTISAPSQAICGVVVLVEVLFSHF
jgi:hypothetical protein